MLHGDKFQVLVKVKVKLKSRLHSKVNKGNIKLTSPCTSRGLRPRLLTSDLQIDRVHPLIMINTSDVFL